MRAISSPFPEHRSDANVARQEMRGSVNRPKLIELNRRFSAVAPDDAALSQREELAQWGRAPTLGWPDLFALPVAVVLGEAGAGKSVELRRAAAILLGRGNAGLFLPVETLAGAGLQGALDPDQRTTFLGWQESDTPAWFFLDSVDESKLKGRSLEAALNALSLGLGDRLPRAHVVVSSRTSDWRATDEDAVAKLRRHIAGDGAEKPDDKSRKPDGGRPRTPGDKPFLFELAPLDRERISLLAQSKDLIAADLEAFLEAVKDADAWSFLERPLDVLAMVGYWKRTRRLGAHRDVVEASIDAKLTEKADRESKLPANKVRRGAQKLALASVLGQNPSFMLPGEAGDEHAGDALVPASVLKDWSDADIKELLSRGLFDEATYGRVRIHHRQAQEYLAAEELIQMVAEGMPKQDLQALLFCAGSSAVLAPTHLHAVAAWCSLKSADVRRLALQVIPEHLLDRGDPSGLPPSDRCAALLAYVERFGQQDRVFHGFDYFGLKRFACPELAATVVELLDRPGIPEHISRLLLEIVECGEIGACAKSALRIALAPASGVHLRVAAIEAAARAGDKADRTALLALAEQDEGRHRNVAATLMRLLYPNEMPDDVFHALVRAVPHPPRRSNDALEAFLSRQVLEICSKQQRHSLLEMLTVHVERSVSSDGESHIRRDRYWLLAALAALIERHVDDADLKTTVREEALAIVETCAEDYDFHSYRSLDVFDKTTALRRVLFWRRVSAYVLRERKFPPHFYYLQTPHLLHLRAADAPWLKADCLERHDVRERLLAIMALHSVMAPQDEATWATVQHVAVKSDARFGTTALQKRLRRWKGNTPEPTYHQWEVEGRAHEFTKKREHAAIHSRFRADLELIREGRHAGALRHFYNTCHGNTANERPDRVSVEAIASQFDPAIAEAARLGFIAFWRREEPPRVENEPVNVVYPSACIGLVGLEFDAEGGTEISDLPDPLLRRAVAYSLWELNGFPPWLLACARRRLEVVAEVFAPMLEIDFAAPDEGDDRLGRVLYKLDHEPSAVSAACAGQLAALLRKGDPPRVSALRFTLRAIASTNALRAPEMVELALARIGSSTGDLERFAAWWSELLIQAPAQAMSCLNEALTRAEPRPMLEAVLDGMVAHLEHRQDRRLEALRQDPEALANFCQLLDAHVPRIEDDEDGNRSSVTELRARLPNWLAAIDDPRATAALRRLAEREGQPSRQREWLQHLAVTRAVADVSKPMSTAQLAQFLDGQILEPRNTEELFAIAKNRLADIEHALRHDDFSLRALFNPEDKAVVEEHVQNYFARELDQLRRGKYIVVREPEVARKKKPDIRLLNHNCGGPVTIELKIAQSWTTEKLEDALMTQLVGQYMSANNSGYGLLVVCSSGPQTSWRPQSGGSLDFPGLIARLAKLAESLRKSSPSIRGLDVVAIDFH